MFFYFVRFFDQSVADQAGEDDVLGDDLAFREAADDVEGEVPVFDEALVSFLGHEDFVREVVDVGFGCFLVQEVDEIRVAVDDLADLAEQLAPKDVLPFPTGGQAKHPSAVGHSSDEAPHLNALEGRDEAEGDAAGGEGFFQMHRDFFFPVNHQMLDGGQAVPELLYVHDGRGLGVFRQPYAHLPPCVEDVWVDVAGAFVPGAEKGGMGDVRNDAEVADAHEFPERQDGVLVAFRLVQQPVFFQVRHDVHQMQREFRFVGMNPGARLLLGTVFVVFGLHVYPLLHGEADRVFQPPCEGERNVLCPVDDRFDVFLGDAGANRQFLALHPHTFQNVSKPFSRMSRFGFYVVIHRLRLLSDISSTLLFYRKR